ncbi:MAG: transketolase [Rhodobacteraceae bacterium]|nr:transketolase [Paracoccaceae bacterium]MCY4249295.1 transketolase [Paracoccaceae bacterium]
MEVSTYKTRFPEHWQLSNAIRALSMDAVQKANSGHPGMPMGMADVATVLFRNHLKFDASNPTWPDRDRFILSAGHGSMLLYSILYLTGYSEITLEQLKNFRQIGFHTAGHPEKFQEAGIETTTGPLGQGLANGIGFAVAEAYLRKKFGKKVINHNTYVLAGDGCLMEGLSQEAISLAGKLNLSNLVVLWDNNEITIDGSITLSDKTDQSKRFEASGWRVLDCDGHNPEEIDSRLDEAIKSSRPTLIACRTVIGFGAPNKQGTASSHGSPLGNEEIQKTREFYGWMHEPFVIPQDCLQIWRTIGEKGKVQREIWQKNLATLGAGKRREFERMFAGALPKRFPATINGIKKKASSEAAKLATRKSSETVLNGLNPIFPEMIGGSADLTGSNNTKTSDLGVFSESDTGSRYIHYGIREHAMAAAMNGMILHGGLRPYGGTFLCFADYARPSIRLSALMELPVIYIMTHDSIGLGEDGPTHQPVEHLSMLRSTPNLLVFRPCDTVETAEVWEIALKQTKTPSILALSRQSLPTLRVRHTRSNLTSRGAYVLADYNGSKDAVLLATGSEVSIAMEARDILHGKGIGARVVSMPSWELFSRQDKAYQQRVLGPGKAVRIGIEAAVQNGWERWLLGFKGKENRTSFIGMSTFGVSAPANDAYGHFGITSENIVNQVLELL